MRSLRMLLCVLVLVVAATAGISASPARAAVPGAQQTLVWGQFCEHVAQGTVSEQEALVCVRFGFPQWDVRVLAFLETVCQRSLGGTFVYRSEYPVELAACFFE
jgi:hypothetical protein